MVERREAEAKIKRGWVVFNEAFILINDVLEGQIKNLDKNQWMGIYTGFYDMCLQKRNYFPGGHSQIYETYGEKLKSYCEVRILSSLEDKHGIFFLKDLWKGWSDYLLMLKYLSHLFHYMERYHIAKNRLKTLKEFGLQIFKEKVYDQIKGKATNVIIDMIHRERERERIDGYLVRNQVDLFLSIREEKLQPHLNNYVTQYYAQDAQNEVYVNDFETHLLANTATYYAQKAANNIAIRTFPDYMIMAEECLKQEKNMAVQYFPTITEPKLLEIVRVQLLSVHSEQLLEKEQSGILNLLADGRMEDLTRMYELFSKINKGLEPICEKFEKCIADDGMRIISQAEDAANQKEDKKDIVGLQEHDFMNRFIELYDRYMNLIENCFSNHSMFHKALRGAFEVLCNKTVAGNSISEIICFFVDNILKKAGGSEKLSDTSIDETFDKIVALLDYVQDKDLFAEFYRKKLARRLINDRSACDDHERSFLTKLKQQFGRQLTSRMEGMITDMTLAREKHSEFSNYLDEHPSEKLRVDLTVTVLTTGFWPTNKISDLQIPEEMSNSIETFERFYTSMTRSRKLIWLFSLGTCIMIGKFDARPIEINLTTYQAVLLLLFNNCDRLSYEEIADQLKLPNHEVNRLLHSLSCSKYKVLNKEPNNKTISAKDVFEFNSKFTNKMSRIKIPVPISEEKKKVIKVVDADRRYTIDAALVRIMKSRKVIGYQLLISECIQQLRARFVPDVKVIKKRIEDLIMREFIKRDESDPNIFNYVA